MKSFIKVVALSCVLLLCNMSFSYADSVSDLLNLYGESRENSNKLELTQREYDEAVENYNNLKQKVIIQESEQFLREDGQKYLSEVTAELEQKVFDLMSENDIIINEISENLLNLSVDDLKTLDSQFKANETTINRILVEIDSVIMPEMIPLEDIDLEQAMTELNQRSKELERVIVVEDIGDVKDFKYVVDYYKHITSPFGSRLDPITKTTIRFHSGLDLRAPMRTKVLSAFAGVVTGTDYLSGYGNTVRIDHGNGIVTLYAHLDSFLVKPGDQVKQYQPIALSGNSGSRSTGPHLHFGLYINGVVRDPTFLLFQ